MAMQHAVTRASGTTNLAEVLERVLDKGIVIAGDIKVALGGIELLAIQIRLVICSVDKASEMGMDWWQKNPALSSRTSRELPSDTLSRIEERLTQLESSLAKAG